MHAGSSYNRAVCRIAERIAEGKYLGRHPDCNRQNFQCVRLQVGEQIFNPRMPACHTEHRSDLKKRHRADGKWFASPKCLPDRTRLVSAEPLRVV
jgi:hypothetical protein